MSFQRFLDFCRLDFAVSFLDFCHFRLKFSERGAMVPVVMFLCISFVQFVIKFSNWWWPRAGRKNSYVFFMEPMVVRCVAKRKYSPMISFVEKKIRGLRWAESQIGRYSKEYSDRG